MPSKKKIKKILIILALLFVNAWFWGNAALRAYILWQYDVISAELSRIPEKLVFAETPIEGKYLYFHGYKLKMPLLKQQDNVSVRHSLLQGHLFHISVDMHANNEVTIKFMYRPRLEHEYEESLPDKAFNWLFERTYSDNESTWKLYYARLEDLSWWNTLENLGIFYILNMKMIGVPRGDFNLYEVETPYITGLLTESASYDAFNFILDDRYYSIAIFRHSKHVLRDFISTIKTVQDLDEGYKEMESLYENNPGYPTELLQLSMISLKKLKDGSQHEIEE
jgi:hypothetical protein